MNLLFLFFGHVANSGSSGFDVGDMSLDMFWPCRYFSDISRPLRDSRYQGSELAMCRRNRRSGESSGLFLSCRNLCVKLKLKILISKLHSPESMCRTQETRWAWKEPCSTLHHWHCWWHRQWENHRVSNCKISFVRHDGLTSMRGVKHRKKKKKKQSGLQSNSWLSWKPNC